MTVEQFKELRKMDINTFSKSTLLYYIEEGNKLLANMKQLDMEIINIVDMLNTIYNK